MPRPLSTRGMSLYAGVLAESRTRHAMQVLDGVDPVDRVILEGDLDDALRSLSFLKLVVEDVALVKQDFGDLLLNFRRWTFHHAVSRTDGIPQSGQIICYWISHCFVV